MPDDPYPKERSIRHPLPDTDLTDDVERLLGRLNDYVFTVEILPDRTVRSVVASPDGTHVFGGNLESGQELVDVIGRAVHPDDRGAFRRYHDAACAGLPAEVECRIVGFDGRTRWIWARTQPRFEDGRLFADGICTNVTDRVEAKAALRAQSDFTRAVLESTACLVIALDADGAIRRFNPACEAVTGSAEEDVLGRSLWDVLTPADGDVPVGEAMAAALHGEGVLSTEGDWVTAGGVRRTIAWTTRPLVALDESDLLVATGIDVTDQRQAEHALRREQAQFRVAFADAPTGVVMSDLSGRYVQVNAAFAALVGRGVDELRGMTIAEITHPDDRERDRVELGRLAIGETMSYSLEKRYVRPDGSLVWAAVQGSLLRDEAGVPIGWIGQMQDVSERRRAEQELREAEQRFRRAFDHSPIGQALVGLDGAWLRVNRALCEITGYEEEVLRSLTFQDITHPDDLDGDLEHVRAMLAGETDHYALEKRYRHADGHWVWILLVVTLVRDADEQPAHFVSQIQDVSERRRNEERLTQLALHDALTELPNRTLLADRLATALARARAQRTGVALLFLDLDGFKAVNDSAGHRAGDAVLREAASRIRSAVRPSDTVARIGGDEFVVLCEDAHEATTALAVSRRIGDRLSLPFVVEGREMTLGASTGVAFSAGGEDDPEELLSRADAAMYRAKHGVGPSAAPRGR